MLKTPFVSRAYTSSIVLSGTTDCLSAPCRARHKQRKETDGAQLTISCEDLALLHVFHKVLLLLVDTSGEALLDGGIDSSLDFVAPLLGLRIGLLFLGTRLPAFFTSQGLTEVGIGATLIVEI